MVQPAHQPVRRPLLTWPRRLHSRWVYTSIARHVRNVQCVMSHIAGCREVPASLPALGSWSAARSLSHSCLQPHGRHERLAAGNLSSLQVDMPTHSRDLNPGRITKTGRRGRNASPQETQCVTHGGKSGTREVRRWLAWSGELS